MTSSPHRGILSEVHRFLLHPPRLPRSSLSLRGRGISVHRHSGRAPPLICPQICMTLYKCIPHTDPLVSYSKGRAATIFLKTDWDFSTAPRAFTRTQFVANDIKTVPFYKEEAASVAVSVFVFMPRNISQINIVKTRILADA